MKTNEGLVSGGLSRVMHSKRYIIWFYVLNVTLAWFGAGAFENQVHTILDHSLHADSLLHGIDMAALVEMFARPEYGPMMASVGPAFHFVLLYFFLTALFMPGVLQGYAANYRLPRDEFFRACGRNLWRFIRLMIIAGIVMGIVAGVLFGIRGALIKAATESTNELLPFTVSMTCLCVIFLVMTVLRIWFDLAEADIVLSDQNRVRKSIGTAFRHTKRNLGRLFGSYLVAAIVAVIILVAGVFLWMYLVPSASVFGAAVFSQLTLLLFLIPRFWQRSISVTYYLQNMVEPIPERSFAPVQVAPVTQPAAVPVIPTPSAEPTGS
jgi:type III secretory pathway component EscS